LISEKPEGSLAKRLAEAVCLNLDHWIMIWRLGLDPTREGVRATLPRRIQIRRSRLSLLSDLMQRAGSKMDGSDSKQGANRYARFGSLGSRSHGSDPPRARSNLTRSPPIGRLREKGKEGAALRRRRPKSAAARLGTRRSSAFPPLRGTKQLELGSGVISATCVIHLGPK
jgi:hypothetical protein